MAIRKVMPCLDGQRHDWDKYIGHGGGWPNPAWDHCRRCNTSREYLVRYCGLLCGGCESEMDERWITYIPDTYALLRGEQIQSRLRSDRGACDDCREQHRREDAYRLAHGQKDIYESNYIAGVQARREERETRQKEREHQWQLERTARQDRHRQRRALRQGHRTMSDIRRVLRGQDPLPQPESTPARSSQTS